MKILKFLKKGVTVAFIVGGIAGVLVTLGAEEMDHQTNTDELDKI